MIGAKQTMTNMNNHATALQEEVRPAQFVLDDFKRMMESLTMCIILHDANTKSILWANQSACDVL